MTIQSLLTWLLTALMFVVLCYVGYVWAWPLIQANAFLGAALVFLIVGAAWHVVK